VKGAILDFSAGKLHPIYFIHPYAVPNYDFLSSAKHKIRHFEKYLNILQYSMSNFVLWG